jgi:hypothetical protein
MSHLLPKRLTLCLIILFIAFITTISTKATTKIIVQKPVIGKNDNNWIFEKVIGSVLKFKNGKEYNTRLYQLKYIGQIANPNKAPFLIFSGRDCDECDANISIYVHSPSNGTLEVANGENRYDYPGTERDIEDKSLLYMARAFYGEILPGINGVIWYSDQLMQNNIWQKSLFIVNLNNGVKKEKILKDSGQLKESLVLLKQGLCKEIKGIDYTSEP